MELNSACASFNVIFLCFFNIPALLNEINYTGKILTRKKRTERFLSSGPSMAVMVLPVRHYSKEANWVCFSSLSSLIVSFFHLDEKSCTQTYTLINLYSNFFCKAFLLSFLVSISLADINSDLEGTGIDIVQSDLR